VLLEERRSPKKRRPLPAAHKEERHLTGGEKKEKGSR
jgi:hypothetical protein